MAGGALDLADNLALRAALAQDNARLYSQQLRAMHALQRSLLPPELPDIPGVEAAAAYQAASEGNEVGGDFYDMFEVAAGRWRFAIGDVCGKGPEAVAVSVVAGLARRQRQHAGRYLSLKGVRERWTVPGGVSAGGIAKISHLRSRAGTCGGARIWRMRHYHGQHPALGGDDHPHLRLIGTRPCGRGPKFMPADTRSGCHHPAR